MTGLKNNAKNIIFQLLWWGAINPKKVILQVTPGLLKRNPVSEKFIEKEWQKKIAAGLKTWPNDTKPQRYHFGGLKISNNDIKILADPSISYQDVLGSRPDNFRKLFKKEYRPIPVSVDMILMAKNKMGEKMLGLTLRNANQDYKAGGFHVTTGGAMEIGKDKKPIDAALRETEEEMGIKPKELSNISCRGIIFNPCQSEIGIMFVATANIPTEKILSRPHDNENNILFIQLKKESLEYWLLEFTHANSVDGIVGALTIGSDLYGKKWAENILAKIIKKSSGYSNAQKRRSLEKKDIKKLKMFLNKKES